MPVCQCLLAVFFDECVGLGFFDDVGHWFLFLFYVDIFSITDKSQMSIKVVHQFPGGDARYFNAGRNRPLLSV